MGFYGHPIDQTYDKPASEIVDEQRFVYPLYVVLLLAPTVHLDFRATSSLGPSVVRRAHGNQCLALDGCSAVATAAARARSRIPDGRQQPAN